MPRRLVREQCVYSALPPGLGRIGSCRRRREVAPVDTERVVPAAASASRRRSGAYVTRYTPKGRAHVRFRVMSSIRSDDGIFVAAQRAVAGIHTIPILSAPFAVQQGSMGATCLAADQPTSDVPFEVRIE